MFSYIAMAWTPEDEVQREAARGISQRVRSLSAGWSTVLDLDGLRVFVAGVRQGSSEAYLLKQDGGVVLGKLFRAGAGLALSNVDARINLGEQECAGILQSRGRDLMTQYWGRYVAFLREPATRSVRVIKDPTGGLPCFYTSRRGVSLFFSRLEDCLALQLLKLTFNWSYIRTHVAIGSFHSDETGLSEIGALHGGECLELSRGNFSSTYYWDPAAVARHEVFDDPVEAARELRNTAKHCIHSWASCYPGGILHQLSGGLDSSIVLGCLKDAPNRPPLTCMNYYRAGGGNSDERPFARLAAKDAGCELVEFERTAQTVRFDALLGVAPTPHPAPHLAFLETSPLTRPLAREYGLSGIFNGNIGDCLFGSHTKEFAAVDYIRAHGIDRGLLRVAADVAPLIQCSIWSVLAGALRDRFRNQVLDAKKGIAAGRHLVTAALTQEVMQQKSYVHPWFRTTNDLLPGKVLHIRTTLGPDESFYDPLGAADDPEEVHPLFSQPLVELCLRMPTYLHVVDGRDRGLARRAFVSDVPHGILSRCWKGGAGNFPQDVVRHNLKFTRELLMDGMLVREKLLDPARLDATLSSGLNETRSEVTEIFEHVITESWLQLSASCRQRIAA